MTEFSRTLEQEMMLWQRKMMKGVLPPDPARIVKNVLAIPPMIEHAIGILPPVIEKVHSEFTEPMVEKLPRLPLTSDFPIKEWLKWLRE